jgi:hypothetical protein
MKLIALQQAFLQVRDHTLFVNMLADKHKFIQPVAPFFAPLAFDVGLVVHIGLVPYPIRIGHAAPPNARGFHPDRTARL